MRGAREWSTPPWPAPTTTSTACRRPSSAGVCARDERRRGDIASARQRPDGARRGADALGSVGARASGASAASHRRVHRSALDHVADGTAALVANRVITSMAGLFSISRHRSRSASPARQKLTLERAASRIDAHAARRLRGAGILPAVFFPQVRARACQMRVTKKRRAFRLIHRSQTAHLAVVALLASSRRGTQSREGRSSVWSRSYSEEVHHEAVHVVDRATCGLTGFVKIHSAGPGVRLDVVVVVAELVDDVTSAS